MSKVAAIIGFNAGAAPRHDATSGNLSQGAGFRIDQNVWFAETDFGCPDGTSRKLHVLV
jgi:hypothetical protein